MIGVHRVIIESIRLKYEFVLRRNITIIQGDSATGKTTLVELLRDYRRTGNSGVIRVQSDKTCVVFDGNEDNWQEQIQLIKDSIVFIDEGFAFIRKKEFAEVIRETDNYYVLITRESLPCIPYSIKEIYGIRTSGKFHYPNQVYHEFFPIYGEDWLERKGSNQSGEKLLVVEDSKSGYQFYKNVCNSKMQCISADGNSNILNNVLKNTKKKNIVVIADGAAFGPYIEKLSYLAKRMNNLLVYLPESFEWIVLKSGLIEIENLQEILEQPSDYIESSKYFSWERYFTDLLEKATLNDKVREYHKDALPVFYLEGKNKKKILAVFPELLKKFLG